MLDSHTHECYLHPTWHLQPRSKLYFLDDLPAFSWSQRLHRAIHSVGSLLTLLGLWHLAELYPYMGGPLCPGSEICPWTTFLPVQVLTLAPHLSFTLCSGLGPFCQATFPSPDRCPYQSAWALTAHAFTVLLTSQPFCKATE